MASSGWSRRRVRCMKHTRSHTVSFDRGFAESEVPNDGTSPGSRVRAGERVEKFRSVFAPFLQSDAHAPLGATLARLKSVSKTHLHGSR
jgi:hypothetical protein